MSRTLLADDGANILVFEDGCDEPNVVNAADYIEEHGYEAFVATMSDAQKKAFLPELDSANIAEYYKCLFDVTYKNGRLNQLIGIRNGAIDGAESAVKAANQYFENDDHKLTAKIMAQRVVYKRAIIRFNAAAQTIGQPPLLSEEDGVVPEGRASEEKLAHLMNTMPRFRDKFRQKIKKHAEEGVAVSIEQLVDEVLASYRK